MPTQNWILFKCMFDSLCGLLFVLTRSSCAPLTLFGFCFCSFQRKPGCHSIGPSLGPSYLISKMCGGICSLWPQTTQLFRVWSEKPFFSFSKRFLVAICRAQPRAGWKGIWGRLVWNPLHASTVEHSRIWFMIPIPAALVCPKTCDTVAEDAYNIASHLSSDRTHDERGILRQARYIEAVLKHTCQRITQLLSKCEVRSPSSLLSQSFFESPWLMIPIPAALVCPETCDTVAEDACNIASHLSSDRTHDERGILRQARYIEAVLKHTCQRITQLFKCEVRSLSFLFPRDSWLQFAGHSHVQVASVYGKGLFETLYKQVLWNIHESGSWFLSQPHWSVPRHVILRQKMLVALPLTFPSTVLTISEEYADKRGIFRQSWSRLSRELLESFSHPSFTPFGLSPWHMGRKPPNFFKCEVRSHSFLFPRDSWLQFAGHSHVQVERVYGEGFSKTLYKQVLWNIHESGSWFLSQQHWSVPRHVILWQKMLVTLPVTFPLTVLTMSEEYSGKRGISRQSWSRHVGELPNCCPSVKWEVLPLFCLRVFLNHPGSWFLSQQHWSVLRHVTLWQKMLATLPVTFPLTLFTASPLFAGKMQDSIFFQVATKNCSGSSPSRWRNTQFQKVSHNRWRKPHTIADN